ncbi:MAG: hypothetical protein ACKV2U_08690 [Bryobacteraceae bacterium]
MTNSKEFATSVGETAAAVKGATDDVRRTAATMLENAGASTAGAVHSTVSAVRNSVAETAAAVKGATDDMRKSTATMLENAGTSTAGALHSTATAVRNAADKIATPIDEMAEGAGQRLLSAASYIGYNDTSGMLYDFQRIVRRHPGTFVLLATTVAATVGYLFGSKSAPRRS